MSSSCGAPMPGANSVESHCNKDLAPQMVVESMIREENQSNGISETSQLDEMSKVVSDRTTSKLRDLEKFKIHGYKKCLTSDTGVKIHDNQNSLRMGDRGPVLLEDFLLREKIMDFDHERIPERVVHARGAGAHGYFQLYEPIPQYSKAEFLNNCQVKVPVFIRFSTVQGSRGSADTVRDVRGFAIKFYTSEGNYDFVGNNIPVFFVQDAIKFPDLAHALKPEPRNEIPQGQSAHDSFWDYISLQPESLHHAIWNMSDRAIPRSYATMEGFAVNTFRLVNTEGKGFFVKIHIKPKSGVVSLIWDESLALAGMDPDYHRKDLWERIETKNYPEYELGFQIIDESDVSKFEFDILDATKLVPESLVPIKIVGKIVLNRNPDNYFAETEQVAFCPGNIVPGIDFTNDPMLQGRLFSYKDTQITRLSGSNFNHIPINKPICLFKNNNRDGYHKTIINTDLTNYEPDSIDNNWPREADENEGFVTYPHNSNCNYRCSSAGGSKCSNGCGSAGGCKCGDGCSCGKECSCRSTEKIRCRPSSFRNFYSQPRMFWLSQTKFERDHIVAAFTFELSKVGRAYIRKRIVDLLSRIDHDLAGAVAGNLSIELTEEQKSRELPGPVNGLTSDVSMSMYTGKERPLGGCKIAVVINDGFCMQSLNETLSTLSQHSIISLVVGPRVGNIKSREDGAFAEAVGTLKANPSLMFDAVIFMGVDENGLNSLRTNGNAIYYAMQAFRHLKPVAFHGNTKMLYEQEIVGKYLDKDYRDEGVLIDENAIQITNQMLKALKRHRIWDRESVYQLIPA